MPFVSLRLSDFLLVSLSNARVSHLPRRSHKYFTEFLEVLNSLFENICWSSLKPKRKTRKCNDPFTNVNAFLGGEGEVL